jgi:hypothetical protein
MELLYMCIQIYMALANAPLFWPCLSGRDRYRAFLSFVLHTYTVQPFTELKFLCACLRRERDHQ